jgi:hypothetical protein
LPISSNLASTGDLDGSGSTQTDGGPVYIYEDTTNDAASFELYPTGTLVGIGVGFTFTYTVL